MHWTWIYLINVLTWPFTLGCFLSMRHDRRRRAFARAYVGCPQPYTSVGCHYFTKARVVLRYGVLPTFTSACSECGQLLSDMPMMKRREYKAYKWADEHGMEWLWIPEK